MWGGPPDRNEPAPAAATNLAFAPRGKVALPDLVRQDIPVISIIGNDAAWTQIRRGQVDLYGPERSVATKLEYTRYDKVVEALGGFGAYVDRVEDLGPALDAAFASKKPSCVNVKIATSEFRKGAISV